MKKKKFKKIVSQTVELTIKNPLMTMEDLFEYFDVKEEDRNSEFADEILDAVKDEMNEKDASRMIDAFRDALIGKEDEKIAKKIMDNGWQISYSWNGWDAYQNGEHRFGCVSLTCETPSSLKEALEMGEPHLKAATKAVLDAIG